MSTEVTLRATPFVRTVVAVCVTAECLFVFLDYHVNYAGLSGIVSVRNVCNIAREDSLASWFGTTQTLLLGLTLWMIFLVVRASGADRSRRIGWGVLAAFFSFMAVDDGAELHERAGTVFKRMHEGDAADSLGGRLLEAFPSYAWQIAWLPLFAVGVYAIVFFWYELPERRTRTVVAAAATCLVVAVGLDFIEGLDPVHPWNLYTRVAEATGLGAFTEYRFQETAYEALRHFSKSLEEFLEMLAITLLWYVSLRKLTRVAEDVRLRFV